MDLKGWDLSCIYQLIWLILSFNYILINMKTNIGDEPAGNLRSRRDFFKTTGQVVAASAIAGGSIPYIHPDESKEQHPACRLSVPMQP